MKKIFLPALAAVAALGLAACDSADTAATDDAAVAADADTAATDDGTAVATDVEAGGDGDSVTISEDGVTADINDGDTSVSANIGEDPSVTVTD